MLYTSNDMFMKAISKLNHASSPTKVIVSMPQSLTIYAVLIASNDRNMMYAKNNFAWFRGKQRQ